MTLVESFYSGDPDVMQISRLITGSKMKIGPLCNRLSLLLDYSEIVALVWAFGRDHLSI